MNQTEKTEKSKECAEVVRNVMKDAGKEITDYDLGYMMGKVDGVTERREMYETKEGPAERELSEQKADSQTAGDLADKSPDAL
jgi:hypothetical protein